MCGVLGVAGPDGQTLVEKLLPDLARRGPDDQGTWISPELSLGHRRLSIIGLERAGRQPMRSRSGHSIIVFNGEIYNYLELADELEDLGRPCDRRFDTSVLLEALEAWGADALSKLNGMFAFAWYRPSKETVLLARDRWGKKPLYWGTFQSTEGQSCLTFSSELRTFVRLPGGEPAPDPLGIARYLTYDGMPNERTIYKTVQKVAAASWLEIDLQGSPIARGRYWRFAPATTAIDPDKAREKATETLARSLELRLRSDVPVGLFLSGGIDSSLLAASWRRLRPGDPIHTFTIGFEDPTYDERQSARLMAKSINAEHHEIVLSGKDLRAGLDTVLDDLPEPLADPSIVPTTLLCRFAREHVTVALGGDGGDELQAGYDPFRAWTAAKWLTSVLPGRFWNKGLAFAERLAPATAVNMSLKFRLHHFRNGLIHPPEERIQGWMSSVSIRQVQEILNPDLVAMIDPNEILEPTRKAFRAVSCVGDLHAQIGTWIATYLECCILAKVDRASMMNSLEVRAPWLDPDVATCLTSLPPFLIYRAGKGKRLMHRMAEYQLPRALLSKPKKGLGVPLTTWYRTVLRERMEDTINSDRTETWFRSTAIWKLWRDHLKGRYDYRKGLWNYLTLASFSAGR